MRTSAITALSKPEGDIKISVGTLAYVNARTQLRAYSLVIKELKKSGITQAQLGKRLGKAPEVISRMLNRPSNWEMKTLSELLFAISGTVLTFSISHPLEKTEVKVIDPVGPAATTIKLSDLSNVQITRSDIKLETAPAPDFYGNTIFCDDIRLELEGKITYVGVYTGSLLVKADF